MLMRILGNRWVGFLILLCMLSGGVIFRMQDYDWTKSLRYLAFDTYNELYPRAQTDLITMVDIDETSLKHEELGQWPWSRSIIADLVTRLTAMGAKAVVFDIVFPEADRTSPENFLRTLRPELRTEIIDNALKDLPDNDDVFAKSIKDSGVVVTGFTRATKLQDDQPIPRVKRPIIFTKDAKYIEENLTPLYAITTNLEAFEKNAAGNGSFAAKPEIDGLIRQVSLLFKIIDQDGNIKRIVPSLSIEAVRVNIDPRLATRVEPYEGATDIDPAYQITLGDYRIPMTNDGKFYVYFAKARPESYVPAWKIFADDVSADRIKDKIVIIGTSAEGLRDIRSTPLDLFIPGVEVHMNVIEQILTGEYLKRPDLMAGAELFFVVVIGLTIIILAGFFGALMIGVLTFSLIFIIGYISVHAYTQYGLLLDPVYPGLCLFILFVTSSLLSYIRSEAQRKQVRGAFSLYISPAFMEELTKDPDKLKLGGAIRDLSVMFTDIRSFTTISERLSPEALIQLMNEFLTPMSDMVMSNRGTIDKYMGDAMMAFWNAPLDDEDHARHACITALEMDKALAPINKRLRLEAEAKGESDPIVLNAGIGINTGPCSVGNMGSKQRFAYSALGDAVNLASRLESQTKNYGAQILIGPNTKACVEDFATLEVDLIQVKGKTEPVHVFALMGDDVYAKTEEFQKWHKLHHDMIMLYRAQKFKEAAALIKECEDCANGKIAVTYELYRERTEAMILHAPGEGWNGVFVATRK